MRAAFCDGYPFERRRIMIEDLDRVVLTRDTGDVGTVVMSVVA
jgi:hypothetical protein